MLTGNYKTLIYMANRRTTKRAINKICEELFAEAVAASLYGNEAHKEKNNADAVLSSIIRLESDYISRISHVEPGMRAADYFKRMHESLTADVEEIIDQINNL